MDLGDIAAGPPTHRPTGKPGEVQDILGADYPGVVITDGAAARACTLQQWCWSRPKRGFEALAELRGGAGYGVRLVACADRVHARYRDFSSGLITHADMVKKLAHIRDQVYRLLPSAAKRAPAICARQVTAGILKQEHKLGTFLGQERVSPTNNLAERCVRMAVLWRASCFGTDSPDGSRYVERIRPFVTSLRLQGCSRDAFYWLVQARMADAQRLLLCAHRIVHRPFVNLHPIARGALFLSAQGRAEPA